MCAGPTPPSGLANKRGKSISSISFAFPFPFLVAAQSAVASCLRRLLLLRLVLNLLGRGSGLLFPLSPANYKAPPRTQPQLPPARGRKLGSSAPPPSPPGRKTAAATATARGLHHPFHSSAKVSNSSTAGSSSAANLIFFLGWMNGLPLDSIRLGFLVVLPPASLVNPIPSLPKGECLADLGHLQFFRFSISPAIPLFFFLACLCFALLV